MGLIASVDGNGKPMMSDPLSSSNCFLLSLSIFCHSLRSWLIHDLTWHSYQALKLTIVENSIIPCYSFWIICWGILLSVWTPLSSTLILSSLIYMGPWVYCNSVTMVGFLHKLSRDYRFDLWDVGTFWKRWSGTELAVTWTIVDW